MAGERSTPGQASYAQSSLPALPAHLQTDTHLTAHLASRYHVSLPVSRLSSQALIAVNTYTSSTKGPHGETSGSAMSEADDLARRAWARLGQRAEDQAILFLGESGSGKTTIRSHLISSLLTLSSTPLSTKLSLAAFVFDSLTTTKSLTTPTASKAGLFLELQYDASSTANPTLIGGKLLDHRLERSRITAVPTGERSFHILYYLLAGTSPAEKAHLGLEKPGIVNDSTTVGTRISGTIGHKRWRYLGHPTQLKVGINDVEGFQHFKTALRKLEFPRGDIAEFCQVLASILHIGQLDFITSEATIPAADESGGYSHEGGETVTVVQNKEVLAIVAAFLGLSVQDLEASLGYKTKTIARERVTVMLDPKGARENADELARTLYSLLVAYIIEQINSRICAGEDAIANVISIVDFPGFAQVASTGSILDQLLNNAAAEALYNTTLHTFFEKKADILESEEVVVAATAYFDNSDAYRALMKQGNGLLSILSDQSRRGRSDMQFLESIRKRFEGKNNAISVGSATTKLPGSNFMVANTAATFTVRHFAGEIDYPVAGLVEENGEVIPGDLLNLIKSTKSDFVRELFGQEALKTVMHPHEKTAIMQAQVSSKPSRMPSMARRRGNKLLKSGDRSIHTVSNQGNDRKSEEKEATGHDRNGHRSLPMDQGASGQFLSSLQNIFQSVSSPTTNPYFVFCIKPNDRRLANQFDSKCVRMQLQTFGIAEISQRLRNADFSVFLPFGEFLGMAGANDTLIASEKEKSEAILADKQWPPNEACIGATGVFLSERYWISIAKGAESSFIGEKSHMFDPEGSDMDDDGVSPTMTRGMDGSKVNLLPSSSHGAYIYGDDTKHRDLHGRDIDGRSDAGASAFHSGDMFRNFDTREQMAEKGNTKTMEEVDIVKASGSRKRWLALVWLLTFYVPDFMIRIVGGMRRKDIRQAWREKLAINLMIWFSCLFVCFFIVVFPQLICPKQDVFSAQELSVHNGKNNHGSYVSIRGDVYDLGAFMPAHYPSIVPQSALKKYAGIDATNLFPVQVSALCNGVTGSVDESVQLNFAPPNGTGAPVVGSLNDPNARYHDFRSFTNDSRPDWWYEQRTMLRSNYRKGAVGYNPQYMMTLASKNRKSIASINGKVYDFTDYLKGGRSRQAPAGQTVSSDVSTDFMDPLVVSIFQEKSGRDITADWQSIKLAPDVKARMNTCLNNLFYVGAVDTRNSARCRFAQYILLAISILLVSVIGFKFFAALQFGGSNIPEHLDKFIICQVPAYTEDEDSLRRAIDSAARMKYDDKRKLLVVVCDGMIIGQGNDRPTPRIVLDILGVSETVDPEPLSFESLGEGMKQHNMGKVYSGLYEAQGHIVPFMVVVKIGKPSEVSRPGNRGKRDSQMVIMRFLNRVHYNYAMSPLELEMHHQIRNIIGVNPTFYEFMLQIDADTVVAPDSASRMVSAFVHDTRLIGICGETALSNAKSSFTTMIQVYEYYISHNLTKAFESLFGSVTCLPGCFTMYRIRAADTGKPLFVSREIIESYSQLRVDTLHMKNLLHLGEDRFLTTLLLKHHPKYKTKYTFDAHAWTIAPDSWKIFMSQRRRWINSTVHNLVELIPLQQLCGFCCFSMRFIVFLDLLSTVVQPVTVAYIVYLIVLIAINSSVVPLMAFVLLGAIYGLQAIIFILRRKWEMIGWMVIYILAMPVFSLGLPLYSFWHMDDFSWGNTRIVTGEKGQQVVISDEGKFDPDSIPRKKWEEYQAELCDMHAQSMTQAQSFRDDQSEVSGISYGTKSFAARDHSQYQLGIAGSEHGGTARPTSQLGLATYGSRLSLATPSEMMPLNPQNAENIAMDDYSAGLPSDDAILAEIRDILKTADLMTVTKKSIKLELERRFAVNMEVKRSYIGSATEAILSGQL